MVPSFPRVAVCAALIAPSAFAGDPVVPYYEMVFAPLVAPVANGTSHGDRVLADGRWIAHQEGISEGYEMPLLLDGASASYLSAWPPFGVVVSSDGVDVHVGWQRVFDGGGPTYATRWVGGVAQDLGLGADSEARDIDALGRVVGFARDPGANGAVRACVWDAGTVTFLPTLGGDESRAYAIDDDGRIVGSAETASGATHPFLWQDGVMTDLGDLGGAGGVAYDVGAGGTVVGALVELDTGRERAFRWQAGVVELLGQLPSTNESKAVSINAHGAIVGHAWYGDWETSGDAFLWYDGVLHELEARVVAGPTLEDLHTAAHIDDEWRITGMGDGPPFTRAYLATPVAPPPIAYDALELGVPPGAELAHPLAVGEGGHVVGWARYPDADPPVIRGWLWTAEDGMQLLPQPPWGGNYRACDVSPDGVVVGWGGPGSTGPGWRYEDGVYTPIAILPQYGVPNFSTAVAIAPNGIVASTSGTYSGPPPNETAVLVHPDGTLQGLDDDASAQDVNASGQVLIDTLFGESVRYTPGVGLLTIATQASARGMNAHGDVVGGRITGPAGFAATRAYRFTDALGLVDIVNISTCASGDFDTAVAINQHGVVVGMSCLPGIANGWVWDAEQGVQLLGGLIDPSLPYFLDEPTDINDAGWITVFGSDNAVGGYRAFLLVPVDDGPVCQPLVEGAGPFPLGISLCGEPLTSRGAAMLDVTGAAPLAPVVVLASSGVAPLPPLGLVVALPPAAQAVLQAGPLGAARLAIPGGGGPATVHVQAFAFDAALPLGLAHSAVVAAAFLP